MGPEVVKKLKNEEIDVDYYTYVGAPSVRRVSGNAISWMIGLMKVLTTPRITQVVERDIEFFHQNLQ